MSSIRFSSSIAVILASVFIVNTAEARFLPVDPVEGGLGSSHSGNRYSFLQCNAVKFTGQERDQGNLDYMHARHYSPIVARFLSVDPAEGSAGSSQSWNRYSYVQNNPVRMVDPTGETPWDFVDPIMAGISIGNLWRKAIAGQEITMADNLQVGGDLLGVLPVVPSLGTYGKGALKLADKGMDIAKSIDKGVDATASGRKLTKHSLESLQRHGFDSLDQVDNIIDNATRVAEQADGATVHIQRVGRGRKTTYNVVVSGDEGIVTGMKNLNRRDLDALASNYGWVAKAEAID